MPGGSVWRLSGVWSARRVDTTMSSRRSCGGFEAPIGAIKKNKTAITKVSFIGVSYIQYPRSPGTLQSKSSAEVDLEKYIRRKIVSTPNFHGRKTITWGPISCPFFHQLFLGSFPLVHAADCTLTVAHAFSRFCSRFLTIPRFLFNVLLTVSQASHGPTVYSAHGQSFLGIHTTDASIAVLFKVRDLKSTSAMRCWARTF